MLGKFVVTVAVLLGSTVRALYINTTEHPYGYINYTTVTGFFLQDEPSTNASTFDYTLYNFGLINRTYPSDPPSYAAGQLSQWQRFECYVNSLNRAAPAGTEYKLIWFGRHAQGYHNAAESYYGTPAWNCYWAQQNGNATTTWDDARLTPVGLASAQVAHDYWLSRHQLQGLPYPQSYYSSPLTRCLQTANITFSGLATPFVPRVLEFLREGISTHTCDRRSERSYIAQAFPQFVIEPQLPQYDELWTGVIAEPGASQNIRSRVVLDRIFATDPNTFLSVTSHSGEISSLLSVLGHQAFSLNTGAIIPVLVKAVKEDASLAPTSTWVPYTTTATCQAPPVTSLSTGGCVCGTATVATSTASATS